MHTYVELGNLTSPKCCTLNLITGEKEVYSFKQKRINMFTGWYFDDGKTFFACYPSKNDWKIWYLGKEFLLTKQLIIKLEKKGIKRKFSIKDYDIEIDYEAQDKWLTFGDILSPLETDEDVDLFYKIYKNYKEDEFYKILQK